MGTRLDASATAAASNTYELDGLNSSPIMDRSNSDNNKSPCSNVTNDATADPMEPFLLLLQRSPDIARRYFRNVSIISVVYRLLDVLFLTSNCFLAYTYYRNYHTRYYGNLTCALTVVPSMVFIGISLARAIHNVRKSRKLGIMNDSRNFASNVIIFVLFPQVGAYYKLLEILRVASKHTRERNYLKPQYFHYIIHLKDESTILYFGSNFIQSTSQFILQGYLFLVISRSPESNLSQLQMLSLISSLLCLTCATAAIEQKSLLSVEWMAVISAFFWKFFSIGSRLCVLILLATVSWFLFLGFCVIHSLTFAILVTVKSVFVANKCQAMILSPLIGIVYIFDDANINYGKTFRNHVIYYTVSFVEGAAILWLWMSSSVQLTWHHYWVSVTIYTCFFLGIFFFRLFYEYNYVHHIKVPIFDCIFGYQIIYDDGGDVTDTGRVRA